VNIFAGVNTQQGCDDDMVLDRGIYQEPAGLYWDMEGDDP